MDEHEVPGTTWGPVTGVPLPVELQALLGSLEPQRARRHGKAPLHTSLAETYTEIGETAVREWLGSAPPSLSSLRSASTGEHFVAHAGEVLPRRQDLGSGATASVVLLYVPRALDWAAASVDRWQELGLTSVTITCGDGVPPPSPPRTRRDRLSGDSTSVDCGGTRVGVQHLRRGLTRLAWVLHQEGTACHVEVMTAQEPLPAVETLLRSEVFT